MTAPRNGDGSSGDPPAESRSLPVPKRRLVVALDGVPWQAVDEVRESGHFQFFQEPARVISPFPTMTNIGMNALMGATRTMGYEQLYFDRDRGRMCGGAVKYVRPRGKAVRGYNHLLDYEEPMQYEFLVYIAPDRIFMSDLRRMLDKFRKSGSATFYAFLKSTDGIIHLGGREKLLKILAHIDAVLGELHEEHRGELEIVAFSDHGNALVPFIRLGLDSHLASLGFEPSNRLSRKRNVIIPGFGLVSYAPIYTDPANRLEIAQALATLPGVDFSVFRLERTDEVTEVLGARGHARILHDADSGGFRYEMVRGDPLSLSATVKALTKAGKIDDRGFARDSDWFEATLEHDYPDALRNLWSSVRDHVESTADVLVSMEDGFCYGSATFNRLVSIAATHGSALRSTSLAFVMSTHRSLPSYLRASEALRWIRR